MFDYGFNVHITTLPRLEKQRLICLYNEVCECLGNYAKCVPIVGQSFVLVSNKEPP